MGASVFMELAVSACATTFTPGLNNILLLSSTSTFGFHPGRIVVFVLVLVLLFVWCAWKIVKTKYYMPSQRP